MSRFDQNRDSVPGQEVQFSSPANSHEPIQVDNLREKFKSLPEKGFLYRVEFAVVDTWSTQFLGSDQKPLVDLWGPDAPRSLILHSGVFDKEGLIDFLINNLYQEVREKLNLGIPVGIRVIVWPQELGDEPDTIAQEKTDSVVEVANTTLVSNLK